MHKLIIFCAAYLYLAGPAALVIVWLRLNSTMRRSLFLRALAAGVLCAAFAYLAGDAYHEQRPFVLQHTTPLVPHAPDNGFPSDHTLFTFACAFVLYPYSAAAAIVVGVAGVFVGWGRVESLLHSPLDVITSFVLAIPASLLSKVIVRRRPKSAKGIKEREAAAVAANGASNGLGEQAIPLTADRIQGKVDQ